MPERLAPARPPPPPPALAGGHRAGAQLAAGAAVVQFEDIWAAQHALDASDAAPVVVSLYNVESLARVGGAEAGGARERWRLASIGSVERRAVRRADLTICVSEADEAHFRALGARHPLLIPNGVDEHLFGLPAGPGKDNRLLFFGQLAYRPNSEGIERFLRRGWPLVREQEPAATLRIAGPGATPPLEALAAATPGVELIGFVDDVAPEIAAARAVVAPIRFGGGTRIKVLEAMAAARPVVGTSLAVEQIGFADGEHGRIRDDDEALARELVALLRDPGSAARLGAAAREQPGATPGRRSHARWSGSTSASRPQPPRQQPVDQRLDVGVGGGEARAQQRDVGEQTGHARHGQDEERRQVERARRLVQRPRARGERQRAAERPAPSPTRSSRNGMPAIPCSSSTCAATKLITW